MSIRTIELPNSNIHIVGTKIDKNGNQVLLVNTTDTNNISIQTSSGLPKIHRLIKQDSKKFMDNIKDEHFNELKNYIKKYSTGRLKKSAEFYEEVNKMKFFDEDGKYISQFREANRKVIFNGKNSNEIKDLVSSIKGVSTKTDKRGKIIIKTRYQGEYTIFKDDEVSIEGNIINVKKPNNLGGSFKIVVDEEDDTEDFNQTTKQVDAFGLGEMERILKETGKDYKYPLGMKFFGRKGSTKTLILSYRDLEYIISCLKKKY